MGRTSRMDAVIAKYIPGSNTKVKGFVSAVVLMGVMSYPVFKQKEVKQGHDYLSSEKPEAIRAGQEKIRKAYRQQRDQQQQGQQQQGQAEQK